MSVMLSSQGLSNSVSRSMASCSVAWLERGRLKLASNSLSKKYLMEHFCFLLKENRWGYFSFRGKGLHDPDQGRSVFPLLGSHFMIFLNGVNNLSKFFHQKDPTGHLACGGV